jgi:hypothetical protein
MAAQNLLQLESAEQPLYAIQNIRRAGMHRWQCTCMQFFYRCVARKRHCKHIHLLVRMARLAHGVSRLAEMGKEAA